MRWLLALATLLAGLASAQVTVNCDRVGVWQPSCPVTSLTVSAKLSAIEASLANVGVSGSTTRSYFVKGVTASGAVAYSNTLTTTTANATLTGSNYTTISWTAYSGAVRYFVYRSASAGTPSTTGLIATSTGTSVNDTGLVAAVGANIPATTGGGSVSTMDALRVGAYSGDQNARIGVEGDVSVSGAVRATGPDQWWNTGAGIELQYVSSVGYLLAYDRDTSAFKPITLNYAGNAVSSQVGVHQSNFDTSGAYNFQVGGGGWFNGDLKVTGAASIPSGGSVWLAGISTTKTIADLTGANSAVAGVQSTSTFTQVTASNTSSLYGSNHATTFSPATTFTQSTTIGQGVFAYFGGAMSTGGTTAISTLIGQNATLGMIGASPTGTITLSRALEVGSFLKSATGSPAVTLTNNAGIIVQDQGAGSGSGGLTITSAQGIAIAATTLATNRYDIQIGGTSIPTGGAWSIMQTSTVRNAFGGKSYFGASTDPTARIHILGSTTSAGTAPIKITSGTVMSTGETGAVEYDGTTFWFTRTGTTRESILTGVSAVVSPTAPNRTIAVVVNGTTLYIAAKTTND